MTRQRSNQFIRLPYFHCDCIREECSHLHILADRQRCRECGRVLTPGTAVVEGYRGLGSDWSHWRTYVYIHAQACTDRTGLSVWGRNFGEPLALEGDS